MSFSIYIIRYALTAIFEGNKSAYARAVRMDEANLRRIIRKTKDGEGNSNLMDLTLELFFRHGLDVQGIVGGYNSTTLEVSSAFKRCSYGNGISHAKSKLAYFAANAKMVGELSIIIQKAEDLIRSIERVYCGQNAFNYAICGQFCEQNDSNLINGPNEGCPCSQLEALMKTLAAAAHDLMK